MAFSRHTRTGRRPIHVGSKQPITQVEGMEWHDTTVSPTVRKEYIEGNWVAIDSGRNVPEIAFLLNANGLGIS